jgi:hypothetical protein
MSIKNEHWFRILNQEFAGTSDRSCVVVAASIIDHLLTETLRSFLVPCPSAQDPLLDGANAPLGTFSARIDAAHRVGLIGIQTARDLHLIRRMRNEQAHSIVGRTFSDPGLKDQVEHLVKSFRLRERATPMLAAPYDSVRGHFTVVIFIVIVYLDDLRRDVQPLGSETSDSLYTTEYTVDDSKNG